MKSRFLIVALALLVVATDSEAYPRRRVQPVYQYPSYQSPSYQQPTILPAVGYGSQSTQPITPAGGTTSFYTPITTAAAPAGASVIVESAGVGDGLDEVNAKRAARGLRPFIRDEGLTQAAQACAAFRAENLLFGHTSNDFAFLPSGSSAASAGCAAYPASYGWMSCCTYEGYTYAGAAWVTGRDGKRYMHLYVR